MTFCGSPNNDVINHLMMKLIWFDSCNRSCSLVICDQRYFSFIWWSYSLIISDQCQNAFDQDDVINFHFWPMQNIFDQNYAINFHFWQMQNDFDQNDAINFHFWQIQNAFDHDDAINVYFWPMPYSLGFWKTHTRLRQNAPSLTPRLLGVGFLVYSKFEIIW